VATRSSLNRPAESGLLPPAEPRIQRARTPVAVGLERVHPGVRWKIAQRMAGCPLRKSCTSVWSGWSPTRHC